MEVKKAHCFFEQSGTFKNEFIKLGIPAEDYDIQDNFGETDHVIDLFKEIDDAYEGKPNTVFDNIRGGEDIMIAFFPCIYFETIQQLDFCLSRNGTQKTPIQKKIAYAIDRLNLRTKFHTYLYKMTSVCADRGIRWVLENPATTPNYLISGQNYPTPTMVDKDRTNMGDYFKKPTAYWFWNCTPEDGHIYQKTPPEMVKKILDCEMSKVAGVCSQERSMISKDYARNWIRAYILGETDDMAELPLLEAMMEGTNE